MPCRCCCKDGCSCGENADCHPDYYCCGQCQPEPCCQTCECSIPPDTDSVCFSSCVVTGGECTLSCGEFDVASVTWAEGFLASVEGCTLLLQVWYEDPDVYFRVWKCNGNRWVDVSEAAFVGDTATLLENGWWCDDRDGGCDGDPAENAPDPFCYPCGLCDCDSLKKVCIETVVVRLSVNPTCRSWCGDECPPDGKTFTVLQTLPGGDPNGTYFLVGVRDYLLAPPAAQSPPDPYCTWQEWDEDHPDSRTCVGQPGEPTLYMALDESYCDCELDPNTNEITEYKLPSAYTYKRWRLVDDCSECAVDLDAGIQRCDGQYTCQEGVSEAYCDDTLTDICDALRESGGPPLPFYPDYYSPRIACLCASETPVCINEFP